MYTSVGRHMLRATSHGYEDASACFDHTKPFVCEADRGVLFAVADGVSRAKRGGESARFACAGLERFFKDPGVAASADGLRTLISELDAEVAGWGGDDGTTRSDGAAALTVAWLTPEHRVVIAQLGDTAAFRLRADAPERAIKLGPDQSIGHGLTHYIGQGCGEARIHVETYPFDEADRLVLVSDGVTKALTASDIGEVVAAARDESEAAETLCTLARRRRSYDDITAMVVFLEQWDDWE